MTDWDKLARELDAWQAAGLEPSFWWRDDDAAGDTPSLRRLIGTAERHAVPLFLAVIPLRARPSLQRLLASRPLVCVLQHGFSHRNHSPRGEPRSELAGRRPAERMLADLEQGRRKLRSMFPGTQRNVLVPPWGRISDELLPALGPAGFSALSMGGDTPARPVPCPRRVDVHVDIVKWRSGFGRARAIASRTAGFLGLEYPSPHDFVGLHEAIDQVVRHLQLRRSGAVGADIPTGLMTHHQAHNERCWAFIDDFLALTREHRSARWLNAEELFGDANRPASAWPGGNRASRDSAASSGHGQIPEP